MQNPRRFYVYALQDENGKAFYIGKGTGNRCFGHFYSSRAEDNPHKWNKIQKLLRQGMNKEEMVYKIAVGMEEDKALKLEKQIIESVGLENLTNMAEGGIQPPNTVLIGEKGPGCKITKQEATWIKWLCLNSEFGCTKLYKHYAENFNSLATVSVFRGIKRKQSWRHIEAEKPPFWDEEFENSRKAMIEKRYKALCKWQDPNNDKSAKEVTEETGVAKHNIRNAKNHNQFGLWDRFLEEHPTYQSSQRRRKRQKIEMQYRALCKWQDPDNNLSAKEVVKEFGILACHIRNIKYNNTFGLWDRYLEEYN